MQIKDGNVIAIGQLFRAERVPSQAAGNVSSEVSLDTDPVIEPYKHGNVIFFENKDGTATHVIVMIKKKG